MSVRRLELQTGDPEVDKPRAKAREEFKVYEEEVKVYNYDDAEFDFPDGNPDLSFFAQLGQVLFWLRA